MKRTSFRICFSAVEQAWNTQTATELSLDGPSGQVYSLVVGNELLFAGTQVLSLSFFVLQLWCSILNNVLLWPCEFIFVIWETLWACLLLQNGRILAWKFSAVGNCFEPAAFFDGHQLSVVSLVVGALRLYSSSMDNTIRVSVMSSKSINPLLCMILTAHYWLLTFIYSAYSLSMYKVICEISLLQAVAFENQILIILTYFNGFLASRESEPI